MSRISPLLATFVGLVIAVLSVMSGIDRLSANASDGGPVLLGGDAQGRNTGARLRAGDHAGALAAARNFVQTSPADPAAAASLAYVALSQKDTATLERAMKVAGAQGWREIPVQLYWLQSSLATGDVAVAQQRLDALMRLDIDNDVIERAIAQLEATPRGAQAMVSLLRQNPPWRDRYAADTSKLPLATLLSRTAVLAEARAKGVRYDCETVVTGVQQLARAGRIGAAKQLWMSTCETVNGDFVSNGNFDHDAGFTGALFDWNPVPRADIDAAIDEAPRPLSGRALHVISSRSSRSAVVTKMLLLPAGSFRLRWDAISDGAARDRSVVPSLICNGAHDNILAGTQPVDLGLTGTAWNFTVPAGCVAQTLGIVKEPADLGATSGSWVDNVGIVRVK